MRVLVSGCAFLLYLSAISSVFLPVVYLLDDSIGHVGLLNDSIGHVGADLAMRRWPGVER